MQKEPSTWPPCTRFAPLWCAHPGTQQAPAIRTAHTAIDRKAWAEVQAWLALQPVHTAWLACKPRRHFVCSVMVRSGH